VAAASIKQKGDLCAALEEILLETGEGAEFLETYAPGVKMVPADSEKLQALQERAQEETHGA